MKKLVLTLPKSYEDLVDIVNENHVNSIDDCLYSNRSSEIDIALKGLGLDDNEEELIMNIYLADEIEFVEEKYLWSLKGIDGSYVHVDSELDLSMAPSEYTATALTESELKAHLDIVTIGVPFNAFMKESI